MIVSLPTLFTNITKRASLRVYFFSWKKLAISNMLLRDDSLVRGKELNAAECFVLFASEEKKNIKDQVQVL